MSKGSEVKWYGNAIVKKIEAITTELLVKTAEQGLGYARINIRDSGRVDTGFLINSGYVAASGGEVDGANKYNPTPQYNPKPNQKRVPVVAPAAAPPTGGAVVGFSAEYALWQEIRKSYLVTGVEQAKKDMAKLAKDVSK